MAGSRTLRGLPTTRRASSPSSMPATAISRGKNIAASTRSEEHTSELQSLMRISYAVFCLKKKTTNTEVRYNTKQLESTHPRLTTSKLSNQRYQTHYILLDTNP